jgi:hypothetical protein
MCFFTGICILIQPAIHCLIQSARGVPKTSMRLGLLFSFFMSSASFFFLNVLLMSHCTYDIDYAISLILNNHYVYVCVLYVFPMSHCLICHRYGISLILYNPTLCVIELHDGCRLVYIWLMSCHKTYAEQCCINCVYESYSITRTIKCGLWGDTTCNSYIL